ncbi:hypothetical protein RB195_011232 [Necator americanus]|uniref:Uncharacterized protein n=2 Tax=Necator americanus TaxID=51031 RepID=A0ABR1D1J2_NECAM
MNGATLDNLMIADVLLSRGLSILYSKDHENSVMAITIAVKIAKYYNSPTTENVISKQECEAQTDRTEMRTAQTQVRRRCKTTGSNTELHLISASELEEAVANIVAEHLANTKDIKTNDETTRDVRMPPSSPIQPVPTSCKSNDLQLGKNIVPRLQKLKVLDKMITERTALVGHFDASLVKIELARKREFILKSRRMSVSIPRTGITDARTSPEMLTRVKSPQKRDTRDVAIQAEKLLSPAVSVQSSSSTPSGSNSSTSGTSDEETESERRETNESESASSTTSSTSSSKETIVRKKSTASSNSHSSAEQTKSPSEVLTRSKPERTTEEPLSPTSLYLKQLREKILQERLQKI